MRNYNKVRYNKYLKYDIKTVIQSRLQLQTVRKSLLSNFGIKDPSLDKIIDLDFLSRFNTWDEQKRTGFILELGGPVNVEKTQSFIQNSINKKYDN